MKYHSRFDSKTYFNACELRDKLIKKESIAIATKDSEQAKKIFEEITGEKLILEKSEFFKDIYTARLEQK